MLKDYIVSQEPRLQYRQSHVIKVVIVKAHSKADAIDQACMEAGSREFKAPTASLLQYSHTYRL